MKYKAVESSQIEAVAHDPETNTLGIRFKPNKHQKEAGERGSEYHYSNVSDKLYEGLVGAVSVGKFFAEHIKNDPLSFPFVRVS